MKEGFLSPPLWWEEGWRGGKMIFGRWGKKGVPSKKTGGYPSLTIITIFNNLLQVEIEISMTLTSVETRTVGLKVVSKSESRVFDSVIRVNWQILPSQLCLKSLKTWILTHSPQLTRISRVNRKFWADSGWLKSHFQWLANTSNSYCRVCRLGLGTFEETSEGPSVDAMISWAH